MKAKSILVCITLLMVVALLAAACGPAAEPPTEAALAATAVPPTTAPAAPTDVPPAAEPSVLRIGVASEPRDLDPQNFSESTSHSILLHVHNTLYELNKELIPVPALAESYELSEDQLTWTFKLKSGINFQDGTPFTAEAVKAIVDKSIGPEPPTRASFMPAADLDSATAIDDYTVEIKTKRPIGPFLYMLSGPAWSINSPAAYEKYGEEATKNPVGTGAYQFVEWKPGEYLVLERNPDYWREEPFYDRLEYYFVPEDATRVALLESGDLDVITNVPPTELPRLEEDPDLDVEIVELNRILYIAINNLLPYLDDPRVRQAMNYAVDKQAIIDSIVGGLGEVANSPVPRLTFGHVPVGEYPYDPDKARSLLAEAGVPDDFEVDLWLPQGRYFQGEAVGQAVANYLREVGLNVNDEVIEYGTFNASIRLPPEESKAQMYMLGWAASSLDAEMALKSPLTTSDWAPNGANRGFYSNPKVDELIDDARATMDLEKRKGLYGEAEKLIWDDAPWIFTHFMKIPIAYRHGITGIHVWPVEPIDVREAKE
jgi:peptide/nickel transport system substrate-binding protein